MVIEVTRSPSALGWSIRLPTTTVGCVGASTTGAATSGTPSPTLTRMVPDEAPLASMTMTPIGSCSVSAPGAGWSSASSRVTL